MNVPSHLLNKAASFCPGVMARDRWQDAQWEIVPVMIGAIGTITKGLIQNLQLLQGHRSSIELRKVTLMTTAHSIRTVLG